MKIQILTLLAAGAMAQEPAALPEGKPPSSQTVPEATRYQKGAAHFLAADIPAALQEWDEQVKEDPASLPRHWQRGIALYYAGRYAEGQQQFEVHQKVNSEDVENAVWHFLCVAKVKDVAAARKSFIPITSDPRVPMKEIHALFAGTGSVESVMKAAAPSPQLSPSAALSRLCYAELYCGLYYEALGETARAKELLVKAAAAFPAGDYMGDTARVHVKLRGWTSVPAKP